MDILTKYYIKDLLAQPIKTSAIHLWMISKGTSPIVKYNTILGATEFIKQNQSQYNKELVTYCGGLDLVTNSPIYCVSELPNVSDAELLILEKIINSNCVEPSHQDVHKIAFWVKFWSIFTLISIVAGAIVLLLTL